MLEVLRAERIKLLRHRATWFLVWIFPIGVTAVIMIVEPIVVARNRKNTISRLKRQLRAESRVTE